ncbi:DotD/TraH family lipoprotein (plasmid) [Lichenicola cladoniae]|uniref:DotD/TraH family lipoprotein n=1 Tax=Lichenicola cladoniae TaxID=1484109 RepID=A0A6M8HY74_9PROT|nr:DotD/TraH family lipoprotein [Lichenicola cladoniae]NPD66341.1 DotD/TraH family lipoprotein [Acetobacteraceae bacterium]QKE93125.1 DotD/TraH family lipoprotein [Lichenicola cladoniae]
MKVDRAKVFETTSPSSGISTVGALLALGLLAGCASTVVPTDVSMTGMPNAELALRRTLDQVNGDMTQIGGMRPSGYAEAAANAPVLPGELQKPVQFVWTGSLDAGVRKLATSIGYTVVVSAPDDAQAISVAINIDGQVISAFRALGDQAGTTATVQVDPQHRQVQVIHHV